MKSLMNTGTVCIVEYVKSEWVCVCVCVWGVCVGGVCVWGVCVWGVGVWGVYGVKSVCVYICVPVGWCMCGRLCVCMSACGVVCEYGVWWRVEARVRECAWRVRAHGVSAEKPQCARGKRRLRSPRTPLPTHVLAGSRRGRGLGAGALILPHKFRTSLLKFNVIFNNLVKYY